jgi:hypothetical protein
MITRLFSYKFSASSNRGSKSAKVKHKPAQNNTSIQDLSRAINILLNDLDLEFTHEKLAHIDLAFEQYHSAGGHLTHFEPKINEMQNAYSQALARASLLERIEPDMTTTAAQKRKNSI